MFFSVGMGWIWVLKSNSHGCPDYYGILPATAVVVGRCKGDFEGERCQEKRNALSDSKKKRRSARRRRHHHGYLRRRMQVRSVFTLPSVQQGMKENQLRLDSCL